MDYAILRFGKYSCPSDGFREGQFPLNPKEPENIEALHDACNIIKSYLYGSESKKTKVICQYEIIDKSDQEKLLDFLKSKYPDHPNLVTIPEYSTGDEIDFILGFRIDNVSEKNKNQIAKTLVESGIIPIEQNNFSVQMHLHFLSTVEKEGRIYIHHQEALTGEYTQIYSRNLLCFQE